MEEGSLLQEALAFMEGMRSGANDDDDLQDVLQMSVYDLTPESNRISQLQKLAQLTSDFNNHVEQSHYLWHSGYPPVFGIHVLQDIPHLRAECRYGDNVNDEWMAIRLLMKLSQEYSTLAMDCWDVHAGPILLIEGSEGLPLWLSEGQVNESRFVCWILHGNVTLIGPTSDGLSLKSALDCLRNNQMLSTPPKLQSEICKTIMNDSVQTQEQRTSLVVPRPVARLLQHAPHLGNAAAVAFAKNPTPVLPRQHEDWVFTTCTLARTNYAMLRTISPPQPNKLTPELKRIQRTCCNEATPHIRNALELGMHLTAGLDVLLSNNVTASSDSSTSPMERRVLQYWTGIDVACGGDGIWLQQAWQSGPNKSPYDMTFVLKCPVFPYEHVFPYPILHPGETMQQVIRSELKRKPLDGENFVIPRSEDVDDEEWIHRGEEILEEAMAKRTSTTSQTDSATAFDVPQEAQFDALLGDFETFMSGESEMEGIAHDESLKRERPGSDEPLRINPRVFLNLLRDVLRSSPEELACNLNGITDDPFFSEEDYALMEPGLRVNDDSDSEGDSEEMETIMVRLWCLLLVVLSLKLLTNPSSLIHTTTGSNGR